VSFLKRHGIYSKFKKAYDINPDNKLDLNHWLINHSFENKMEKVILRGFIWHKSLGNSHIDYDQNEFWKKYDLLWREQCKRLIS
jgi:hypothetical protein